MKKTIPMSISSRPADLARFIERVAHVLRIDPDRVHLGIAEGQLTEIRVSTQEHPHVRACLDDAEVITLADAGILRGSMAWFETAARSVE